MRTILSLLQHTAALLGLDQKRCVACFTPYSPITDSSFADLYNMQHSTVPATHGHWNTPPQLCPDCLKELPPRTKGYCPVCGKLYATESGTPARCSRCLVSPPPWTRMTFFGAYKGLLRELLLQHKFHSRLDTGITLARLLASTYQPAETPPAAVIPLPLHTARLKARGHNQTLLPAILLAQKMDIPLLPKALRRIRATIPQASLTKQERQTNLQHAFSANLPKTLRGTHLLLVDDIATTCMTLEYAATALLAGGAGSIEVAVIARTPEPSDTTSP
ncbi:MAG: ComF family protein [Desulfovibrionales bacterium]|nr:ComF family protein [Desulfovibrionales bacterium]